jgi:hypothetical protein
MDETKQKVMSFSKQNYEDLYSEILLAIGANQRIILGRGKKSPSSE